MSTPKRHPKGPTREELARWGEEWGVRTRLAQGLPATVEDEETLRKIVRLLRRPDEKPAPRRTDDDS